MKGLTMLSLNSNAEKVSTWDKHVLDAYLVGAVVSMSGKSKAEAAEIAENYVRTTDRSGIRESAIDAKAAELKKEAKQFGLREKLNYATDADHDVKLELVAIGATSLVETMAKSEVMPNGPVALVVPKNALKVAVGSMVKADTPDKKVKADEYAAVKHAQLVLKQLKRCVLAEFDPNRTPKKSLMQEAGELYARFGNPSGGMVHNDMPAEKPAVEPAAKAESAKEGKKSLWQEAKEMYAAYGNPSGGMVHNDMPAEKPAAEPAAKAEPAKEGKSMWQEAKELFATYGNPSGGMVHNDMPAEKPAAEPAAKAEPAKEGKKSLWQEAGELYARFGNPSGGMVHNDMPAEKPAAEPAAKAEPAKEGKKSLWQEAKEMYATYGNPSGGMTHKDAPAKKDDAKAVVAAVVADRRRGR